MGQLRGRSYDAPMAARSIGSGRITLALVSIPVKIYSAVSAEKAVSFNLLHEHKRRAEGADPNGALEPCGSRVKQFLRCEAEGVDIERSECVSGFEYARDQYVVVKEDDFKAIEAEQSGTIEIEECVPPDTIDPHFVEKSFYLGHDKGGERGYKLLADTLRDRGVVAIADHAKRGRNTLVIIRPYRGGLMMQEAYYLEEIRDFADVERPGDNVTIHPGERKLARQVVDQITVRSYEPSRRRDEYAARLRELVARKIAGQEVITPPPKPSRGTGDLEADLRASIAAVSEKPVSAIGPKKAAPRETKRRRKA
jgi:DNA end-binding protein Ku